MVGRIDGTAAVGTGANVRSTEKSGSGTFGAMLQERISFSKHAMKRAEERGIQVTDSLVDKLSQSVEKAQEKGATNILAFDANQAFIINIPYGRVITTMSQEEMQDNVFTNIDGAVLLK